MDKKSVKQDPKGKNEKDWWYFWHRVWNDLTNKDLVPVKILFFFKYATLFVLYPFLTLHMSELGLDEWEIGINQATAPVVAILGPPFVGIIADKIGNFKNLLSFLTFVNAAIALLLLLVPKARETVIFDHTLTFQLICSTTINNYSYNHQLILESLDTVPCVNINDTNSIISPAVIQCGLICPLLTNSNNQYPNLNFNSSSINPSDYEKYGNEFLLPGGMKTMRFFDNFDPHGFLNLKNGSRNNILKLNDNIIPTRINSTNGLQLELMNDEFTINDKTEKCSETNGGAGEDDTHDGCHSACVVQWPRYEFCSNDRERKENNVGLTFGLYTLFRVLLGFASATSFIMFEGAVLAIMKEYGGDYGLQRVSATLAAVIAAPVSGMILNKFGFRSVIYLYAGLKAISALVTLAIDLEFKKPAEKVIRNLRQVLSQVEIIIFFAAMLWSGASWGYLETFLFLYLERMGGSKLLMGLTITVGGLVGLPLLIFSRPIIKRLGHVNCLALGLLFYSMRYLGYSVITDPWQALIFEAGEAITVSLAITAASTYAVALSNLQTIASIQGIMGCLYFLIGRGAGSVIGGVLIKTIGHVDTFRVFGLCSLVGSIVYFLVNLFYLRNHSSAHKGLDINNLQMNMGTNKVPSVIVVKGHEGPLDVNKFTDIPLDEETKS